MASGLIQINDFSQGANNWLDRTLLQEKIATQMHDCSPISGVLESSFEDLGVAAKSAAELGHYGDTNRSVAKQFGRWYWSFNDAKAAPYYGGDKINGLGMAYPASPPQVKAVAKEGATLAGNYKYCATFVRDGYESAPGAVGDGYYSNLTLAEGQEGSYLVGNVPAGVTSVNVYRTIAERADFYLLESITPEQAKSWRPDSLPDNDLLMHNPLESLYYLPPPEGGKYLTEFGETFFLAVGDKLYYSEIANCHAWNPSSWIAFDDTITGMIEEFQGILVFTANRVYRVTGNDLLTIAKQEIPTHQGCVNWRTCAILSNAPTWLSNDGICTWDGQSIKLLSFQKFRLNNTPRFAVSANDRYFLFGDNGTIVYDLRCGGIFYTSSTVADYAWYDVDRDHLYLRINGVYYIQGGNRSRRTSVYRSALLGGNLPLTEMRKMRVSSTGRIEFALRDHFGKLILRGAIAGSGTREVWLPSGKWTRGVDVEITFRGSLREIAFVPAQTMA